MNSMTISAIVKKDHATVDQLYQNYLKSQGNLPEQERFSTQFQQELTKHATAEEAVLYPAFEKYLGSEGKKIADEDRMEHQTVKKLLHKLKETPVSDSQHRMIFDELMTNLTKHVAGEENNDLPKFESAITPDLST
ncbi:unnamed protein product, partial [Rotaria sordida]